jgi:diguanylate cyclase (GGDEF)-like protein/PAS domain S-box-containing protein
MPERKVEQTEWRPLNSIKISSIGRLFVLGLIILGALVLFTSITVIHNTSTTESAWNLFEEAQSEKARALNKLRSELGYGGMIHHFKNFILRGGEERMRQVDLNLGGAKSAISNYQSLVTSAREKKALDGITTTLDNYYSSLLKAKELIDSGSSSVTIDNFVKIYDGPALEGLSVLSEEINTAIHSKNMSKAHLINFLRKAVGYGGMIHNFKNYILRKEDKYKVLAQEELVTAQDILNKYLAHNNTAEELESIQILIHGFNKYKDALIKAEELINEGLSVNEIDKAILVDDTPALNALAVLSHELNKQINIQAQTVTNTLHHMSVTGVHFIVISLTLIIVLIALSLWLIHARITRPISHLTNAMTKLTKDDLEISLHEVMEENEIGEMAHAVQIFKDNIIERKQAEDALKISEKKYRGLLENSSDGMVIVDKEGKIETVNQQLLLMTGYASAELINQPIEILTPERFKSHEQQREDYVAKPRSRMMGDHDDIFVQCKDGTEFPAEISLNPLGTGNKQSVSATVRDITERKEADEQLNYQACHDALTGLVNRREFERRTERLLATVQHDKIEHALCFMDLDQFKVVNDTCGHAAGDELLRQLTLALQSVVRKRDTLARLGGDEFGLLMEHCSLDQAYRVATTIQKTIQDNQFSWEGQTFKVGVSIGLVAANEATPNLTELLKEADAACYMAKELGRNRIHVYHAGDSEIAKRSGEMQWVSRLNQALEEDRFCLYAQIIAPLGFSSDEHYEILLRMLDETGKIIPPGAFLPAAERYNLISKIDCWVIENTFTVLGNNPVFLEQINFCSINLSGQSLTNPEKLNFIITQLDESGVDAEKICFEITETAAISNLSMAVKFISTLKGLGCRFALDDFGSGLSSFAYLKNLSVDYLKIDGIFVKDITDDQIDRAMVKSINEIGHVMGMKTIAEFVENDEIKGMLREIGVNYAQGYGIGKPEPLDEIINRINNPINFNDLKK